VNCHFFKVRPNFRNLFSENESFMFWHSIEKILTQNFNPLWRNWPKYVNKYIWKNKLWPKDAHMWKFLCQNHLFICYLRSRINCRSWTLLYASKIKSVFKQMSVTSLLGITKPPRLFWKIKFSASWCPPAYSAMHAFLHSAQLKHFSTWN
jgi:hypothetical protein